MDDPYIDWDAELSNTKRHIEAASDAKCALDLLVQKGCSEFLILQNAFLYCGGEPTAIQSIRQEFRRQRARMVAVSKQLLDMGDSIDALASFINSDLGMEIHPTPNTKQMRTYANTLQRMADTIVKDMGNCRMSGRDQHIVFLHEVIHRTTGRDHYAEIAAITDAVAQGYDPEGAKSHGAEDVRRLLERSGMFDVECELSEIIGQEDLKGLELIGLFGGLFRRPASPRQPALHNIRKRKR